MDNKKFTEMWFDAAKDKADDKLYYHGKQIVEAKDFLPVLKEVKRMQSQINFLLIVSVIAFSLAASLLIVFFCILKYI